jgi:hypothetical protein
MSRVLGKQGSYFRADASSALTTACAKVLNNISFSNPALTIRNSFAVVICCEVSLCADYAQPVFSPNGRHQSYCMQRVLNV